MARRPAPRKRRARPARERRAARELAQFKGFLADLIEGANALIAVVNRRREVLVFNRALVRLTGIPRAEALGRDLLGLLPEAERPRVEAALARALAGGEGDLLETRLRLPGGGEARVSLATSAIAGAAGEAEGIVAIGQDVTLLRGLQARAEHARKLAELGTLAAGVVHELANPLTAVAAYSESLVQKLSRAGGDPADLAKLRRIHEASRRLQRLARDLMAYARPPAEARAPLDLAALLDEAAGLCEPVLRAAGARVERALRPVPAVRGQRGSLVQVFVNLVTNAAQALRPGGGVVRLESAVERGRVAARVRDDGRGMPPEVQRRVFEPFFTTREDGGGTGLGLAIVQGIVERHGGAIEVESRPGRGTAFTVLLPPDA